MHDLNLSQQQAVSAPDGPQLILAGAGSGKTRTIIHRIGHLIAERRYAPHRILAVTFTNKAAQELNERLTQLIGDGGGGVQAGTFHSVSLRFLRRYADALGYPKDFQILDADDQKTLVKRILKQRNIDAKKLHPNYLMGWIEHCKHAGMTPEQTPDQQFNGFNMRELYTQYQTSLFGLERMDFSDLILQAVILMRNHPEIATAMQSRFDHVLVDEYQDTNPVQHEWLSLLCRNHQNLTVVGDDDQSIYGWRGANVRHILDFSEQWPQAGIHRLEENYRSTKAILQLANGVIQDNEDRHSKTLRATRGPGTTPKLLTCNDEYHEARLVLDWLKERYAQGVAWDEMAILYRSNRQSLVLEQLLRQDNLPYQIIGGIGFFERMEIKDAMAFWALLNRCGDAMHLLRIANKPKRGIGPKALENITASLNSSGLHAADWLDLLLSTPDKSMAKLIPLAGSFQEIRTSIDEQADRGLWQILEISGYLESLKAQGEVEAESRIENLRTLQQYIELSLTQGLTPIEFMDQAALLQTDENVDEQSDETAASPPAISLMSLHRAKGLEFDSVALTGVEEGLIPHQRSIDEGGDALAEERRLLYVGITRAKNALLLTQARVRRLFGDLIYARPSRFLKHVPEEYLTTSQSQSSSSLSSGTQNGSINFHADVPFAIGDDVMHPSFGLGTILSLEGSGDATRVSIQFQRSGLKRLMLKYASLNKA